jgi:hypothetical protein
MTFLAIGFLAVGLFSSPFLHAHVHSPHDHDGQDGSGTAVHAHLPETHRDSNSEHGRSIDEGDHGKVLHLFLTLMMEKSRSQIGIASGAGAYAKPVPSVIENRRFEKLTRTRDPASSAATSRAPPTSLL